jgi:Flp pilus assembly protein TadG
MLVRRRRPCPRGGHTIVEASLVITVVLLFLFGILEYGRYLMVLHIADNAAREGARYAVVNTGDGVTQSQVVSVVNASMAGMTNNIQNYNVNVFTVDMTQIYNTSTNTYLYPSSYNLTAASGSNWNDAQFGQAIAVQITGTYNPILPSFLQLPSMPVNIICIMNSEAN